MADKPNAYGESSEGGELDRERRLGEVLATYFAAVEAGSGLTPQELVAQHPELAEELEGFFADQERFGRVVAPLRRVAQAARAEAATLSGAESTSPSRAEIPRAAPTTSQSEGQGLIPDRIADTVDQADDSGPVAAEGLDTDADLSRGTSVRYFGDYELWSVLGKGGMGVVYKAKQLSLNRMVAVKMIRAGTWAGDDELRRFRNEAESVANLDHPQIVTIHEVGRYDGQHYFSMKLVDGPSLAEHLVPYTADPRSAAQLVADVARAVHHAHQRGILHREFKPSNIVLDAEGRPHVTDFGLAKRIEGGGSLSASDAIVGTPSYMSPEQASGRKGTITTAVDTYGLGAILYAALTGRPPFQSDSVVETLEQVRERAPERPSLVNRRVPRDLDTICLKCLEKDPKRRYDSAAVLADDVERYLRDEPIQARRTSTWERVLKWSRRRPAVAALVGMTGVAALTLAGLGVALFIHSQLRSAYAEVERQRGIAEGQRGIAEGALARERTFLYQNRVIFAERALNDNTPDRAEELLDECPPALRNWEWNYLKRQCHTDLLTIPTHQGFCRSIAISSDGRLLVTSSTQLGSVMLWRADSGELVRTLSGHITDEGVWCAFSPDGTRIASVSGSVNLPNHLLVHQVASGEEVLRVPVRTSRYASVAFSPDGREVVVASGLTEIKTDRAGKSAGWVMVYDAVTGHERVSFATEDKDAFFPSFSPNGKSVIALLGRWTSDDTVRTPFDVRVWAARTGEVRLKICNEKTRSLTSARFSSNGRMIATCGVDTALRLWDAQEGRERMVFRGHRACTNFAAFSPDGRRVATTSDDGLARIWDIQTGEFLFALRGHRGAFDAVVFSPDGQRLVTSSPDDTVRIWNATTSTEALTITASNSPVRALAFSPDGHRLVTGGFDGALKLWEVPSGRFIRAWPGHTQPVWDVAFSPDGTRVASAAGDWMKADQLGEVHICDATSGLVLHPLRAHQAVAWRVRFSPDGRWLVSAGGETSKLGQEIIRWDASNGTRKHTIPIPEGGVLGLALSRDGRRITTGMRNAIRTWDVETGKSLSRLEQPSVDTGSLDYRRDGRTLFSTNNMGSLGVWDVVTSQSLKTLRADNSMTFGVVVNPAGTRVATVGSDHTVKL
jgi:eukaryotic-like serine/threonine-protein kinase